MIWAIYTYAFLNRQDQRGAKIGRSSKPYGSTSRVYCYRYGIRRLGGIHVLERYPDEDAAREREREIVLILRARGWQHMNLIAVNPQRKGIVTLSRETFYHPNEKETINGN